ncbi:MAG: bifunctional phosphopantothenoylcysteine decarboxylase/phosphopantothenate--cysteine ligase CoaBC [Thermoplasmatota archaeon]
MHPADEIRCSKSTLLVKKKIVLAVTGSIAAVETVKLARELIRHGADVIPVMTSAATKIIHPDSLWFATGHQPTIQLTGETEHVTWCGEGKDNVDLVLISPCTANTLSKIAQGVDDTPVTTFATTAIGSGIPVMIVPAMHRSMYNHHIVQENVQCLRKKGIIFVDPFLDETKAKMASIQQVVLYVKQVLGSHDLQGKKVLVIGGGTAEPIDAVRKLANTSSGKMAVACVTKAFLRDAQIFFWYGTGTESVPDGIANVIRFKTIDDLKKLISTQHVHEFDIVIVCAALSDFIPEKHTGKISSTKEMLSLQCKPAEKIIPLLRKKTKDAILVGFKLEKDRENLVSKAVDLQKKYDLQFVVANLTNNMNIVRGEVWIVDGEGNTVHLKGKKTMIADGIYDLINQSL